MFRIGTGSRLLYFLFNLVIGCLAWYSPGYSQSSNPVTSSHSPDEYDEAESSHRQAWSLLDQGDYREALSLAQKALHQREFRWGSTHRKVAESLNLLGLASYYLAEIDEAQHLHERALRIRKELTGSSSAETGESLTNLARVWLSKGDLTKAHEMLEQALHIREQNFGPDHMRAAETLMYLAMVQGLQMNLKTALETQGRAVGIFEKDPRSPPLEHSMALTSYGVILSRSGELAKGKMFIERALLMQEDSLGKGHPVVARTLDSLAELQTKMGHPAESLPLAERALHIRETKLGPTHPETSASLHTLGTLYWKQGDLSRAARYFQRALSIVEQSVGALHPVIAANLLSLGEIQRQKGELTAAQDLLTRALHIQEFILGPEHPDVGSTLTRLAWLAGSQGDHVQAETLLRRVVQIRIDALGETHPDLALALTELARVKHRQGRLEEARNHYEQARAIYLAVSRVNQDLDEATFSRLHQQALAGLQDYALLLVQLMQQDSHPRFTESIIADVFLVAEQARGWLVQSAVAKAMARRMTGRPEDTKLIDTITNLRRRREKLRDTLHTFYGHSTSQSSHISQLKALKQELHDIHAHLDVHIAQLETQVPHYSEMAFPKPLDLQSVQEHLHPGEALLSFYTWEHVLQIWLIRSGHPPHFLTLSIAKHNVSELVTRIRSSLHSAKQPFDVRAASQLYQWLFQPLASHLEAIDHLIIIPDEILLPLPFAVLLTERRGADFNRLSNLFLNSSALTDLHAREYANLPWLIKRFPLTIVPSASAFQLLRQPFKKPQNSGDRFIGFGDPILGGHGPERGGTMLPKDKSRVAFDQLRMMNALPGTQHELLAIAQTLGVDPKTHVFLKSRATETHVRQLLQSGRLGNTQVLSFATHGLLAGQLQGLVEPALVLTIPEHPTKEDDGLLTMGEILDFQLPNVDWVILSACNTGGDDGNGQGLTGLARAFFFAGAKALLVSHWSVDDRATQALMTQVFRLFGGETSLAKSTALQKGILAVMDEGKTGSFSYFSHPYAWAPFFLVGDGR